MRNPSIVKKINEYCYKGFEEKYYFFIVEHRNIKKKINID